ncbi:MAG: hypothetical protein AAFO69_02830 [Bacteroidota bacterium]
MSLQKGFLRKAPPVNQHMLAISIILGLNAVLIFYAFFFHLKESFRVATGLYEYSVFIELTSKEEFFYKWFFAAIACVMGLESGFSFYNLNTLGQANVHRKRAKLYLLAYGGFVKWTFLHVFIKFFVVSGIALLTFAIQFNISLQNEFPALLILVPVVLFFQQWPILLKLIGRKGLRLMWGTGGVIIILSLLMTQITFFDVEAVNHKMKKTNPLIAYDIDLPEIRVPSFIERRRLLRKLYVAYDEANGSCRIIAIGHEKVLLLSDLDEFIRSEKRQLYEYEHRRLAIQLFADKEVPYVFIQALRQQLRKAGIRRLFYAAGAKNSAYPPYHPTFRDVGLYQYLYPYNKEFDVFTDSLAGLNPDKYQVRLSGSLLYRVGSEQRSNRILVKVTNEGLRLNGVLKSPQYIEDFVIRFVKKYSPDFVILFETEPDITYEEYIETQDILRYAIDKLRRQKSLAVHGVAYEWSGAGLFDAAKIRAAYPMNIVEWHPEEQRMVDWMRKSRSITSE